MFCALVALLLLLILFKDTSFDKSNRISKEYDKYGSCFCPDPDLLDRI